jgi:hypothetical protein
VVRPGYLPEPLVLTVLPFAALALGVATDAAWTWATRPRDPAPRPALRRVVVVAAALALVCGATPVWVRGDAALAGANDITPVKQAERWLESHRQKGRLLVDNTVWADLASDGYAPSQLVWFSKLDFVNNLDPSVRRTIRHWSDLNVIVSSPIVRGALDASPRSFGLIRQAQAHSRRLAVFGSGNDRIEVLAVAPPTRPST